MDPFLKDKSAYRRRFRLVPTYQKEAATYLSVMTGRPYEEALAFVQRQTSPQGLFPMKSPKTDVLVRQDNGDRELVSMPLHQFITDVFKNNEIMAPSMTSYLHPNQLTSQLALFVEGNLARRKKAKGEMFSATMAGNKTLAAIKNSEQTSYKLSNNSLSGAHVSESTPLYNKTGHSTLTSGCRTGTSYGNANNEKFLCGNRHYWCPDVVKANVISIINHTDMDAFAAVMAKYELRCPTVQETYDCIEYSTRLYWRDDNQMAKIRQLVEGLSDLQRAVFVFTGDFYHLSLINPEFARTFIKEMGQKIHTPLEQDAAKAAIKQLDGNLTAFTSIVCMEELRGKEFKDLKERPEDEAIFGATAQHKLDVLAKYTDFIRVMWISDNIPSSIYYVNSIIRRGAVLSDTDSTVFTVQRWTQWYRGELDFTQESKVVANVLIYLSASIIRHVLARVSGNMGVAEQHISRLSMKNEYYFPTFSLTARAKHYYADIEAQEGNVYSKLKPEIKGVALRNSTVPVHINKRSKWLMSWIQQEVRAGRKISLTRLLRFVALLEKSIVDDIRSGNVKMLTKATVKDASSYKNPESSPYQHYEMWNEVFGPKYGFAPEPPYSAVRASCTTDSPSRFKEWLDGLEDKALAERMRAFCARTGKKYVGSLVLPEPVLSVSGTPNEIIEAMDLRSIISATMETFYLILESLGYYFRDKFISKLISDEKWLLVPESEWHLPELVYPEEG